MNNQGSNAGQVFRLAILAFLAMYIWQSFTAQKNQVPPTPPRPMPALAEAFKGIDRSQGAILAPEAGKAEIKTLREKIATNPNDEYSYWARLRIGLIQQYILKNLEMKPRPPSFWRSLSGMFTYSPSEYSIYDEITDAWAINAVDAQAHYQKGNWLWQQAVEQGGKQASQRAAYPFEQLILKGRGSPEFLNLKIYAPVNNSSSSALSSSSGPPEFRLVTVGELRETKPGSDLPLGILDRVNEYHKTTFFYRMFDTVVTLFGKNPAYSYGLAILFFATMTRLLIQPLTKKQYDSMKGMQIIAPEMKKIQEKYKGKTDQAAQVQMMKEIRELQARHGVNPMLGCGLAIIQMPIFFFFVYPLIQHYEPQMELVRASFLWIQNLAQPDILLLVLYGISMFLSFRLSSTPPTDEQQKMMQTMMAFIFPIFFPFVLKSYPSAFTMYWMMFNVVSTFFQWRMMKAADPNKSIIKSLMGTAEPVAVAAVPERPVKSEDKKDTRREEKKATAKTSANEAVPSRSKSPRSTPDASTELNGLNGKSHSNGLNGASNSSDGDAEAVSVEQGTTGAQNRSQSGANRNNSQRARRRRRH